MNILQRIKLWLDYLAVIFIQSITIILLKLFEAIAENLSKHIKMMKNLEGRQIDASPRAPWTLGTALVTVH